MLRSGASEAGHAMAASRVPLVAAQGSLNCICTCMGASVRSPLPPASPTPQLQAGPAGPTGAAGPVSARRATAGCRALRMHSMRCPWRLLDSSERSCAAARPARPPGTLRPTGTPRPPRRCEHCQWLPGLAGWPARNVAQAVLAAAPPASSLLQPSAARLHRLCSTLPRPADWLDGIHRAAGASWFHRGAGASRRGEMRRPCDRLRWPHHQGLHAG